MICYSNNSTGDGLSHRRSSILSDLLKIESFQFLISDESKDFNLSAEDTSKRNLVQHNYHDHSCDPSNVQARPPAKGGVTVPFPLKLYDMLDKIHSDPELASIVNWQPHGRCFLVRRQKEFTEKVMPRFFQQKKYASFQRQLNLYGFSRITRGPDRGSYYHECLLRGKRFLSFNIKRVKIKGTGGRMASNPSEEPNFYMMPGLPDPQSPNPIQSSRGPPFSRSKRDERSCEPNLYMMPGLPDPQSPNPIQSSRGPPFSRSKRDERSCESNAYVFGDMPFYPTEVKKTSGRRHSLEDPRLFRRNSLMYEPPQSDGGRQRNSIPVDETLVAQLEAISSMSKTVETDEELGSMLEKTLFV